MAVGVKLWDQMSEAWEEALISWDTMRTYAAWNGATWDSTTVRRLRGCLRGGWTVLPRAD